MYRRFGSSLYSEQEGILSHGFSVVPQFLWAGCGIKSLALHIDQFGDRVFFEGDLGLLSKAHENLFLGASLKNLSHPLLREFRAGAAFRPIQGLFWMLDLEQIPGHPFLFRTGAEFDLARSFSIRSGFQKFPLQYSAGFGLRFRAVQLDYAYSSHENLSDTHLFSFTLEFERCW